MALNWQKMVYQRDEARDWAIRCYRRMRWLEGEAEEAYADVNDRFKRHQDCYNWALKLQREKSELQAELDNRNAWKDIPWKQ